MMNQSIDIDRIDRSRVTNIDRQDCRPMMYPPFVDHDHYGVYYIVYWHIVSCYPMKVDQSVDDSIRYDLGPTPKRSTLVVWQH